jgi:hypothetical protein
VAVVSELAQTLLLAGIVCLEAFAVIAYVLVRGDWWRR